MAGMTAWLEVGVYCNNGEVGVGKSAPFDTDITGSNINEVLLGRGGVTPIPEADVKKYMEDEGILASVDVCGAYGNCPPAGGEALFWCVTVTTDVVVSADTGVR